MVVIVVYSAQQSRRTYSDKTLRLIDAHNIIIYLSICIIRRSRELLRKRRIHARGGVGNQTTRRRGGGVGRWVLAVRLGKRHPFSRLPQRRFRLFPYIEHPTDNSRAVIRYFHRPQGGGLSMEMGTTHHQTRWGVGIEGSLEKWPSHWSNVFLPTS